jgi:hypothetical protein
MNCELSLLHIAFLILQSIHVRITHGDRTHALTVSDRVAARGRTDHENEASAGKFDTERMIS